MPFTIDRYSLIRPHLYHLTARSNLKRIRQTMVLVSAARIIAEVGRTDLMREKRKSSNLFEIRGEMVHVRDQAPLHAGNLSLPDNWSLSDFVELLNHHVFFWAGNQGGPIEYGDRHYARYADENPAVLRITVSDIVRANAENPPLFCKFNSGSPRCSYGRPSPRGPETFVRAEDASFPPSAVVEVTFQGEVTLPETTELRTKKNGWVALL